MPVNVNTSDIAMLRVGLFLKNSQDIRTTIRGLQYQSTIASPVSIDSIAKKYANETVVIPRAPIASISRIIFSVGKGSLRKIICRKTSIIKLAIVNLTVITPSGFAPDSYACLAKLGPIEKPRLDIITNNVPTNFGFFATD
jgi:hypothetical protein